MCKITPLLHKYLLNPEPKVVRVGRSVTRGNQYVLHAKGSASYVPGQTSLPSKIDGNVEQSSRDGHLIDVVRKGV